jgi:NADPH-dependent 2,4-dienoyl-CoA reductase/sulfur reductase-like enzyme
LDAKDMKHVIIGNGPAGVVAAETLRKVSPDASIALVGDEPEPPYSRMALPYYLVGQIGEEGTYLRKDAAHFERQRINLLRARARSVDTRVRAVKLDDGTTLTYDRLLVATGSHPIRPPIPGIDSPQVHTCWTLEDARRIARLAQPGARVLQLGAGFIGCIILEALASRGVQLTVVEMGDRMVPRMMTPGAGTMIKRWCEHKGVHVHTATRVEALSPSSEQPGAVAAKLSSGDTLLADLVICAAGVRPNVAFLKDSGVALEAGILVDERMQTTVPDIYAAGDVTEATDFVSGKRVLNAIQPNAADQARVAALNMAGLPTRFRGSLAINVLDTLGLISSSFGQWWGEVGGEGVELRDDKNYRYLSLQFKGDVLIGATAVGLTEHVGVLRGLIQGRTRLGDWKDRLLDDPTRIMEAYLARSQRADIRYLGTRPI